MFPWECLVNSSFFILKITNTGNVARYTAVDFFVMQLLALARQWLALFTTNDSIGIFKLIID
jgi:hypothetical protein